MEYEKNSTENERKTFPCFFNNCPRNTNPYSYEKARNNHELKVHAFVREVKRPESPLLEREPEDHIFKYQKALLSINLLLKNINDSIREGDGERLLVCYKVALLYFKSTGHVKYAFSLLKMFYRIKLCPSDAFRLIWGRFINTHGFLGHNIPNDLHMEHLNGYLKELLRSLRGNMNEKNADRIARALNNTRIIVNNFEKNLIAESRKTSGKTPKTFNDVKKLTEELNSAEVFKEKGQRSYESFPEFKENVFITLKKSDLCKWIKDKETEFTKLYTT